MKKLTVALMALLVSGCTTVDSPEFQERLASAVPPSHSVKSQIIRDARDFLFDPYSIRDAEITNVATDMAGVQWLCVKANAKNALGGYSGRSTILIYVKDDRLTGHAMQHPFCQLQNLKWSPFKELENLKNI